MCKPQPQPDPTLLAAREEHQIYTTFVVIGLLLMRKSSNSPFILGYRRNRNSQALKFSNAGIPQIRNFNTTVTEARPLKEPTILTKYEGKEKGTEYWEILLNVRSRNRIDKGRYKDKTKSLSFLKT